MRRFLVPGVSRRAVEFRELGKDLRLFLWGERGFDSCEVDVAVGADHGDPSAVGGDGHDSGSVVGEGSGNV